MSVVVSVASADVHACGNRTVASRRGTTGVGTGTTHHGSSHAGGRCPGRSASRGRERQPTLLLGRVRATHSAYPTGS